MPGQKFLALCYAIQNANIETKSLNELEPKVGICKILYKKAKTLMRGGFQTNILQFKKRDNYHYSIHQMIFSSQK